MNNLKPQNIIHLLKMYRRDLETVIGCLRMERETVVQLCEDKKRLIRENEDLRYENMNLKAENINLRRQVRDYIHTIRIPVPIPVKQKSPHKSKGNRKNVYKKTLMTKSHDELTSQPQPDISRTATNVN